MNETFSLIHAFLTGFLLGVFFFGGLWWTLRKIALYKRSKFWIFGSLLIRMSVVITGFYIIWQSQLEKLLISFVGFIFARFIVLQITRLFEKHANVKQEVIHEP